ncbi:MAG: RNA methyltransferase [Bacteroidales bacterium]|nr:RNA methyltransferase [Bacteroidales bacterium]MCF8336710.1 RNA methyltransferase [Bacteroidales bacterium]
MKQLSELTREEKQQLFEYLAGFITSNKLNQFENVLEYRTRYVTAGIENIYQPQNASAVLRTCDLFGVQDVHIVENNNEYRVNPQVALGASKWLNMYYYNEGDFNTPALYDALRSQNYRVVATTPHRHDYSLDEFPLEPGPVALMFGTEMEGLSDWAIENADEFVRIPMYGFTESFNISVSAALIIRELTERVRRSDIQWQLPEEKKMDIRLEWARRVIKRSDLLEREFLNRL